MKEDRKTGNQTNVPVDTQAFIRQISLVGNESVIQENISEVIPEAAQKNMPPVNPLNQPEMATDTEPAEEKAKEPAKRKKGQIDYENQFLTRNELRNRQGLYIDRDNYETLQTLVRAIRSERLSVSGLVDNIVSRHIETYSDEINRIYEENIRKPIKKN